MVDHKPVKAPSSRPRPEATLLFWFLYLLSVALAVIDILFVLLKLTLT